MRGIRHQLFVNEVEARRASVDPKSPSNRSLPSTQGYPTTNATRSLSPTRLPETVIEKPMKNQVLSVSEVKQLVLQLRRPTLALNPNNPYLQPQTTKFKAAPQFYIGNMRRESEPQTERQLSS